VRAVRGSKPRHAVLMKRTSIRGDKRTGTELRTVLVLRGEGEEVIRRLVRSEKTGSSRLAVLQIRCSLSFP
jgi:hypothetical protein